MSEIEEQAQKILDSLNPQKRKAIVQFMVLLDGAAVVRELDIYHQWYPITEMLGTLADIVLDDAGFTSDEREAFVKARPPIQY